jgi:hypothetical protein
MIISAQLISKGNTEGVPGWGVALSLGWSWLAEVMRNGMCMFLVLVPADAVTPAETDDGVPVVFEPQFEHINQQTTEGAEDRAARHRKEWEEVQKRHQKDEKTAIRELKAKQKAERNKLEKQYPASSKEEIRNKQIATQRIKCYYKEGRGLQERDQLKSDHRLERKIAARWSQIPQ